MKPENIPVALHGALAFFLFELGQVCVLDEIHDPHRARHSDRAPVERHQNILREWPHALSGPVFVTEGNGQLLAKLLALHRAITFQGGIVVTDKPTSALVKDISLLLPHGLPPLSLFRMNAETDRPARFAPAWSFRYSSFVSR